MGPDTMLFAAQRRMSVGMRKEGETWRPNRAPGADVADSDTSETGCIVSVLMLREGWDVNNVTVVAGLRPFTAKANILPEQAVGRGLP